MKYFVYILKCSDNTYYIGVTNDLEKRLIAHNKLKSGAKYTRGRRPVELLYHQEFLSISAALKKEAALKKLSRTEKERLLSLHHPQGDV